MSKILNFTLSLEFSDSIEKKKEILEIATNIARAIESEVNSGEGIAPVDNAYTLSVTVKSDLIDEEITKKMF